MPVRIFDSVDARVEDVLGGYPGQTFSNWYNGPAPVWMYQRAMYRDVYGYYPENKGEFAVPTVDDTYRGMWNYPKNWWDGFDQYAEVTGASQPGLPASPPLAWLDGWPGSGIFLKLGRTIVGLNKLDILEKLATLEASKYGGPEFLQANFGTVEPTRIAGKIMMSVGEDDYSTLPGPIIRLGAPGGSHIKCRINFLRQSKPLGIPSHRPEMKVGEIVTPRDLGFWGIEQFDALDTKAWCDKQDIDDCTAEIAKGNPYLAGRVNDTTIFDEALFVLALRNNIDTTQEVKASNGSGGGQYEIAVTSGYPPKAAERDYSDFLYVDANEGEEDLKGCIASTQGLGETDKSTWRRLKYDEDFAIEHHRNHIRNLLSLRDPLDVLNEDKALPVTYPEVKGSKLPWTPWSWNLTAAGHISSVFCCDASTAIFGAPYDQCQRPNT